MQPLVSYFLNLSGSRRSRRGVSFLLLLTFSMGLLGLPLLTPSPEKIGRFPCEECPCGCASADFCWDKCCCHTDVEKLQWAAANDVRPPNFLVARVAAKSAQQIATDVKKPSRRSCCCCKPEPQTKADLEAISEASCGIAKQAVAGRMKSSSRRWVRLEDLAQCRGANWIWTLMSQVTVDVQPAENLFADNPRVLYTYALFDATAYSLRWHPDPPVPWRFSA